jgi:hypothetical protein
LGFIATATPTPVPRYDLAVSVYDSSGHLVKVLLTTQVTGPPSNLSLSSDPFFVDGTSLLSIKSGSNDFTAYWDGLASDGLRAAPGAYEIQATYVEFGKTVHEVRNISFSVLWRSTALASAAILAPNPAHTVVRLSWPASPGYALNLRCYNIAGELVLNRIHLDGAVGYEDWDLHSPQGLPLADGIYVLVLEVQDGSGSVVERRLMKLVITR